ncbi:MAG TPA: hypothetical protein VM008_03255, partial [Phycisphaerae bacterium]|nr:hypothetical protein [Phycisphaerae bacterium]
MSESNGRSITAIVPIAADAMDESVVPVGGKSIPWGSTWVILLSFSAIMSSILVVGLHSQRGFFIPVLTTGICILAALFDAWTTRIPNALTYGAIVA